MEVRESDPAGVPELVAMDDVRQEGLGVVVGDAPKLLLSLYIGRFPTYTR